MVSRGLVVWLSLIEGGLRNTNYYLSKIPVKTSNFSSNRHLKGSAKSHTADHPWSQTGDECMIWYQRANYLQSPSRTAWSTHTNFRHDPVMMKAVRRPLHFKDHLHPQEARCSARRFQSDLHLNA